MPKWTWDLTGRESDKKDGHWNRPAIYGYIWWLEKKDTAKEGGKIASTGSKLAHF